MRKVRDAVDLTTNEKIYFKGHAKATFLSDGRNVEDTMGGIAEAVMGIHENLSANYATKQYVDNALAEIPSAESSVFEAVYGETTYDEIVEANNEGKIILCRKGTLIARLTSVSTSLAYFEAMSSAYSYQYICQASGVWYEQRIDTNHALKTLDNGNVQVTIAGKTAEVATPQYVENAIQQSGGSSATPDWNANEGEEGFIKNKPFNLVTEDVDFELYDGRAAAYISDIEDYDGFYILDKLMQFNGNYNFTIDYYEGFEAYHGITIELQYNDVYITPNYTDEFDSIESFVDHCNEIIKVSKIKVIDTFFIPDTVIKTTPQELLDTDKNQALSNLGIDPIVWKYICNPLIIEDGMDVPDELYVEGSDCLKYGYTAMYKFYESSEYRFCVQADYDRLIDSKDQNWYINMKTFYLE